MNWGDIGIPSIIVLLSGGAFFWYHRITQGTIKNLETRLSHSKEKNEELSQPKKSGKKNSTGHDPESDVVVFQVIPGKKYNQPFYEYFIMQIKNSSHDIYITGDGFECVDETGNEIASNFINAFRYALNNNKDLRVVRIETKSRSHLKWAKMLSGMIEDYGERFQLYILPEEKSSQIASVCIIDSDSDKKSIVEIMLSTQRLFGVKPADLAGTGVFIHNQPYLAQDLRRRIIELKNSKFASAPATSAEVINLLSSEEMYFSFGSNMNPDLMKDRCPSAEKVGVALLADHEIVFNRKGSYRPGGVASVQQNKSKRVYGIIWKINPLDFEKLDKAEDPEAYIRFEEDILTLDGKTLRCHVYKAIPQGKFDPDKEYLKLMITSGQQQNLPEEYITYLKSFE